MNILAIETATAYCSVALETPQGLLFRFESQPRQHAQKILPMIDELLNEVGMTLSQINAIAISIGPGSFTSLRIGVGIVQGLAFVHQIPVIPVSTLAAVAQGAIRLLNLKNNKLHILLDAHMKEFFYGVYHEENGLAIAMQEDQLISADKMPSALALSCEERKEMCEYLITDIKDLSSSLQIIQLQDMLLPSAVDVIKLAKQNSKIIDTVHLQPVYLRTESAWKK